MNNKMERFDGLSSSGLNVCIDQYAHQSILL